MPKRVLTVSPMPAEKCAYALARYSRSPDSIADSIEWVRTHDSQKFLESFYFQYGHASIADLGHVVTCFEGVSELARRLRTSNSGMARHVRRGTRISPSPASLRRPSFPRNRPPDIARPAPR